MSEKTNNKTDTGRKTNRDSWHFGRKVEGIVTLSTTWWNKYHVVKKHTNYVLGFQNKHLWEKKKHIYMIEKCNLKWR